MNNLMQLNSSLTPINITYSPGTAKWRGFLLLVFLGPFSILTLQLNSSLTPINITNSPGTAKWRGFLLQVFQGLIFQLI